MFRLFRSITLRQCFTEQVPALVGAAVIAEVFYKFHSFALETGAFLATWLVLDLLLQGVAWLLGPVVRRTPARPPSQDIHPRDQIPALFIGSSGGGVWMTDSASPGGRAPGTVA